MKIQCGDSHAYKQALMLWADDLAKMPREFAQHAMEWRQFMSVWLNDVLRRAGIPHGSELRGKALAGYVFAQ
jgi:hypothetical protein